MATLNMAQIYPGAPAAQPPTENVRPGSAQAPSPTGWDTKPAMIAGWIGLSLPMLVAFGILAWAMIRFSPV